MSYMRGDIYAFVSGNENENDSINIWTIDKCETADPDHYPSGIQIPLNKFDELVLMRYAQLSEEEKNNIKIMAIENNGGNVGCYALQENEKNNINQAVSSES